MTSKDTINSSTGASQTILTIQRRRKNQYSHENACELEQGPTRKTRKWTGLSNQHCHPLGQLDIVMYNILLCWLGKVEAKAM